MFVQCGNWARDITLTVADRAFTTIAPSDSEPDRLRKRDHSRTIEMNIKPIEDDNSRFDLVEIKSTHPSVSPTPHCKIHGAMNCVASFETGRLWRCIQSNMVKDCRAGCEEVR